MNKGHKGGEGISFSIWSFDFTIGDLQDPGSNVRKAFSERRDVDHNYALWVEGPVSFRVRLLTLGLLAVAIPLCYYLVTHY